MQRVSLSEYAPFFFGRKKGVFCVLGFYIDDSADHGRKTVFSVAGFVVILHLYLDLNMPNLKNIEYREPKDQLSIQRVLDYIGVVGSLHNPTLLADGPFLANDEFLHQLLASQPE